MMFRQLLITMRPRQWLKNIFVLPALLFSKHLLDPGYVVRSLAAVGCFCLVSSAVYLVNDVADAEQDRRHPRKAQRPVAAGLLSPTSAGLAALVLGVMGVAGALRLDTRFGLLILLYALLNLGYSLGLKRVVLVDVMLVASGFLLRALGGALVIRVPISPWFVLCSFTLALFLATVKRRQELVALAGRAAGQRSTLAEYSLPFLDQTISMLAAATLVCYALYAMGVGSVSSGSHPMQWTIPFVLYGILRYLLLVFRSELGDNPTAVVWHDRPLQIDILLWIVSSMLGYYLWP